MYGGVGVECVGWGRGRECRVGVGVESVGGGRGRDCRVG